MRRTQTDPFKFALRLISMRDITELELRSKLERKGFSEDEIEKVIEKLRERGFIDDSKFIKKAERIAEDKMIGQFGLRQYLIRRGINKELVDEIPQLDETSIAIKLIDKKSHFLKDIPEDKKRAKIAGFLIRRGFSWDTINKVINQTYLKGNETKENKAEGGLI